MDLSRGKCRRQRRGPASNTAPTPAFAAESNYAFVDGSARYLKYGGVGLAPGFVGHQRRRPHRQLPSSRPKSFASPRQAASLEQLRHRFWSGRDKIKSAAILGSTVATQTAVHAPIGCGSTRPSVLRVSFPNTIKSQVQRPRLVQDLLRLPAKFLLP